MDTWGFSLWLQQKVTVLGAHLKGLFTRWLVYQVFLSPKYADFFNLFQCEGSFIDSRCTFKNKITFGPVGYHQQEWYISLPSTRFMEVIKSPTKNLLFCFMEGFQMLHNILKQNRTDFYRIPIVRKLLKVCTYFHKIYLFISSAVASTCCMVSSWHIIYPLFPPFSNKCSFW